MGTVRKYSGAWDVLVNSDSGAQVITQAHGLPVPLAFSDPGSDAYSAAIQPSRVVGLMRVVVGDSGVVISLDDGVTASMSLPPNCMDLIPLAGVGPTTQIKVRRYTAGVAMTDLIVEVS
jgi:hypothetical protein